MMHYVAIRFQATNGILSGHNITPRALHGLLYAVLTQAAPAGADWLHKHPAPKPYTLLPYYTEPGGRLAGLRMSALNDETAGVLLRAWQRAKRHKSEQQLGGQRLCVTYVESIPGPDFETLASVEPAPQVSVRFVSPTSFRQGPGDLPLPLPVNVFRGPFMSWQAFAPNQLHLPGDWLDWCAENVFVTAHRTETVPVRLDRQHSFVGFVGEATFEALDSSVLYQATLQSLARLAPYSGVGRKTTMGLGAVEFVTEEL